MKDELARLDVHTSCRNCKASYEVTFRGGYVAFAHQQVSMHCACCGSQNLATLTYGYDADGKQVLK